MIYVQPCGNQIQQTQLDDINNKNCIISLENIILIVQVRGSPATGPAYRRITMRIRNRCYSTTEQYSRDGRSAHVGAGEGRGRYPDQHQPGGGGMLRPPDSTDAHPNAVHTHTRPQRCSGSAIDKTIISTHTIREDTCIPEKGQSRADVCETAHYHWKGVNNRWTRGLRIGATGGAHLSLYCLLLCFVLCGVCWREHGKLHTVDCWRWEFFLAGDDTSTWTSWCVDRLPSIRLLR